MGLFRRKRAERRSPAEPTRSPGHGQRSAEVVLDGRWTAQLYDYGPVRVPAIPDVDSFLEQRPLPSPRPGDRAFNDYVGGNDAFLRTLWAYVLLHHPDPTVVTDCLRSPHLPRGSSLTTDTIADLLVDAEFAEEAAASVWRLDASGLRYVLNVVLSRGVEPSGFTADQAAGALRLLDRSCPAESRSALAARVAEEPPDSSIGVFGTALDLVALTDALERGYSQLTEHERHQLLWQASDELLASGDEVTGAVADNVEIRRIGYRLEEYGGLDLMREVASCAGDLSPHREAERSLNRCWNCIGGWMS